MENNLPQPSRKSRTSTTLYVVAAVIMLGLGIAALMYLMRGNVHLANNNGSAFSSGQMPSGGSGSSGEHFVTRGANGQRQEYGSRPIIGQVTAISAGSITVQPSSGGNNQAFNITSSTQIIDNQQSVTYTDIQVGATVAIAASSSSSNQAGIILVNPNLSNAQQ